VLRFAPLLADAGHAATPARSHDASYLLVANGCPVAGAA
jgi:hypothetical protein